MNIEDRARAAADDLRQKAATVPPPGVAEAKRRVPALAFAAGFAVVALLVLLPLVVFGGPREGDDSADPTASTTTTTATTAPPTTTTVNSSTAPETVTTVGQGTGVQTVVISDVAAVVPAADAPAVVASFEWGDGAIEIGTNEKGVGPCCFDVASDGTIVVVDTAHLRLLATGPRDAGTRVIAEWEAGDFVPHAILIKPLAQNDIIHVLGMTNRTGRPDDLITMALDGTVIDRGEVAVEFNSEMVVSVGSVWAVNWRGPRAEWTAIAGEVGDVRPLESRAPEETLLIGDRGSLDVTARPQATGITVAVRDVDGNGTDYEIDFDTETWGHQVVPWGDGFVVVAHTSRVDVDGSVGRVAARFDRAGKLVEGFAWEGSFFAEVGPRGLATVRNGAIYEMNSSEAGVEIRRYPMASARAADEVAARTADARAIDRFGQWTWIATAPDSDGNTEILKLNNNAELQATYDVPLEIEAIDAEGPAVWFIGADSESSHVGRLAIGSEDTWIGEIDDFPAVDLIAEGASAIVLFMNDQSGTGGLLFVADPEAGDRQAVILANNYTPVGMVMVDDTLWIATEEGTILRYDRGTALFADDINVGVELVDIALVADVYDRFGHAIWVGGSDGSVHRYDSDDGTKTSTYQFEGRPLLASDRGSEVPYIILDNGDVYVAGEDWPPELILETGIKDVTQALYDGRLWLGSLDTLEIIRFGQ